MYCCISDEPVLYVGNHRSFFDILLTYSRCKRLTGYIAKKEMEKVPLLSIWMRFVYCLFLDRENPKEGLKTILKAIEYIKKGISICIFPEGKLIFQRSERPTLSLNMENRSTRMNWIRIRKSISVNM